MNPLTTTDILITNDIFVGRQKNLFARLKKIMPFFLAVFGPFLTPNSLFCPRSSRNSQLCDSNNAGRLRQALLVPITFKMCSSMSWVVAREKIKWLTFLEFFYWQLNFCSKCGKSQLFTQKFSASIYAWKSWDFPHFEQRFNCQ